MYKIADSRVAKTGKPSLCTKTVDPLDIIAAPPIVFSSWRKTQNWGNPGSTSASNGANKTCS